MKDGAARQRDYFAAQQNARLCRKALPTAIQIRGIMTKERARP